MTRFRFSVTACVFWLSCEICRAQYTYESTERQCIFNFHGSGGGEGSADGTSLADKLARIDRKLNAVLNATASTAGQGKTASSGPNGDTARPRDDMKISDGLYERISELENRVNILENTLSAVDKTGGQLCPVNFTRFAGHCYQFHTECWLSWFAAGADCIEKGGHLVSIETPQEDLFLLQMIRSTKEGDEPFGYWTGGTNMVINQTWVWAHSGEPLGYSRFQPGGDSHDGYYSLELHKKNPMRRWDDTMPHIAMAYICEMEMDD